MIRLGIVGTNYGRTVQLPAFRADPRCEVVALAGSDAGRTAQLAREAGVARGYGGWRELVEDKNVDAVAIATLPSLQAQIAIRALELGKPVFIEKPMASDLAGARAMLQQARLAGKPTMIDFNFHQIAAWQRAKQILDAGHIGALRHIVINWQVESRAIQTRMRNWKTVAATMAAASSAISSATASIIWNGLPGRSAACPHASAACPTIRRPKPPWPWPCNTNGTVGQPVDELRVLSRHRASHRVFRRGRHLGAPQSWRRLHARLRMPTPSGPGLMQRIRGRGPGRRAISGWPHRAGVAAGQTFFDAIETAARRRPALPKVIACKC